MYNPVALFLGTFLLIPLVALWGYHLFLGRGRTPPLRRRKATLALSVLIICLWLAAYLFVRFRIPDVYLIAVGFLAAAIVYWQKTALFPWRLRCAKCGRALPIRRVLGVDSDECETCEKETSQ